MFPSEEYDTLVRSLQRFAKNKAVEDEIHRYVRLTNVLRGGMHAATKGLVLTCIEAGQEPPSIEKAYLECGYRLITRRVKRKFWRNLTIDEVRTYRTLHSVATKSSSGLLDLPSFFIHVL